jgi:hypothetical protein
MLVAAVVVYLLAVLLVLAAQVVAEMRVQAVTPQTIPVLPELLTQEVVVAGQVYRAIPAF